VKLGDLSVAGSHDAGVFYSPIKQDWYVTQTFNIRDQLCRGIRFFDIRLKKDGEIWKTLHPGWTLGKVIKLPDAFASSWDDIAAGIIEFAQDESHAHEVIYIRIKLVDALSNLEAVLTRNNDPKTPSLKPWMVHQKKELGDKIMQYTMKDLVTDGKKGAKVVMMAMDWKASSSDYFFNYIQKAEKGQTRTVTGKFSSSRARERVFTHTCSGFLAFLTEKSKYICKNEKQTGQFGKLQEWIDAGQEKQNLMHVTYLTMTFGTIRPNTVTQIGGKSGDTQNAYLLNDFLVMSTYNYGSPGNVVMTDYCGDPTVWGGAKFFTGVKVVAETYAQGNALVAGLMAYNLAKVNKVGFLDCAADVPADKKVAGVCGATPNAGGLKYSKATSSTAYKPINVKEGMVRDPKDPTKKEPKPTQAEVSVEGGSAEELAVLPMAARQEVTTK